MIFIVLRRELFWLLENGMLEERAGLMLGRSGSGIPCSGECMEVNIGMSKKICFGSVYTNIPNFPRILRIVKIGWRISVTTDGGQSLGFVFGSTWECFELTMSCNSL